MFLIEKIGETIRHYQLYWITIKLKETISSSIRVQILVSLHRVKSIYNVDIATTMQPKEKAKSCCELTAHSKPFKPVHLLTSAIEPAAWGLRSPRAEVSQAGSPVACRLLLLPTKTSEQVLGAVMAEEEQKWKWKQHSKVQLGCLQRISVEINGDQPDLLASFWDSNSFSLHIYCSRRLRWFSFCFVCPLSGIA